LGASFSNQISKELVQLGIEEIKKFQQEANSTISSAEVNGGRKRRRVNVSDSSIALSRHHKVVEKAEGTDLSIAIIKCLRTLVSVCGSLMDRKVRIEIDTLLFKSLSPVIKGSSFLLESKAPISRDDVLRLEFYKALLSSILSPVKGCHISQLLPHAVGIFIQGKKDRNIDVADFCVLAAATTQLILHPTSPSLLPFSIAQEHAGPENQITTSATIPEAQDQISTNYTLIVQSVSKREENDDKITQALENRNIIQPESTENLGAVFDSKVVSGDIEENPDALSDSKVVSEDAEIVVEVTDWKANSGNTESLPATETRLDEIDQLEKDNTIEVISEASFEQVSNADFVQVPDEKDEDDSDSDIPDIVL